MINIQENISLQNFTTFGIGGPARFFTVVKDEAGLREAISFAKTRRLPLFVLGGGSNLLVSEAGFSGLVIKNEIKGFKFIDQKDKVLLEIGAGENLDEIVNLSINRKLSNLENLSGIPGTVGGAAVQNAGAYGSEIKDCLFSVAGLNAKNGKNFNLLKTDCEYGYRSSFFKKNKKYIITTVTLELDRKPNLNIQYGGLKDILALDLEITPQKIREAVLSIRAEKLPDWHKLGTAGSFFKNPVVTEKKYMELKEKFSTIPGFPDKKGKVKIPLAWILDKICNLKGYKEGEAGLCDKQPIILVNMGGATAKEIINLADKIKKIVREKVGIEIEEEVERI